MKEIALLLEEYNKHNGLPNHRTFIMFYHDSSGRVITKRDNHEDVLFRFRDEKELKSRLHITVLT